MISWIGQLEVEWLILFGEHLCNFLPTIQKKMAEEAAAEQPAGEAPAPEAAPAPAAPAAQEKGLTITVERVPGHNWGLTVTGGADQVVFFHLCDQNLFSPFSTFP